MLGYRICMIFYRHELDYITWGPQFLFGLEVEDEVGEIKGSIADNVNPICLVEFDITYMIYTIKMQVPL